MRHRTATIVVAGLLLVHLLGCSRPEKPDGTVESNRTSIAIFDLHNLSGDESLEWMATTLPELLRFELSTEESLRLIARDRIDRFVRESKLAPGWHKDSVALAKAREFLSADLVIVGTYAGNESALQIDLALADCRNGRLVSELSETTPAAAPFNASDRAARGVFEALGIASRDPAEKGALVALRPASTEAARHYAEGLQALRHSQLVEARGCLEKAIEADPEHSLSHSALATVLATMGYQALATDTAKRGHELASGLTRQQRLVIEGQYRELLGEVGPAVEIYAALNNLFPDDIEYGIMLMRAQLAGSRLDEAQRTLSRLEALAPPISNDPRIPLMAASLAEARSDFRAELRAAQTVVRLAKATESPTMEANGLLKRSWANRNLGNLEDASESARAARDLFAESGDRAGEARATNVLATLVRQKGDYVRSEAMDLESLAAFREIGDRRGEGFALNNLGRSVYEQGRMTLARLRFEEVLEVVRDIGDKQGEVRALSNISSIELNLSNQEEAMRAIKEAISIAEVIGDSRLEHWGFSNLSLIEFDLGEIESALELQQRALAGFREIGDRRGLIVGSAQYCGQLVQLGRLAEAKPVCQEGIGNARELGGRRQLAFALAPMGDLALLEGRIDEARRVHEEALALATELGDHWWIARERLALATIALEEEHHETAAQLARSSAEGFEQEHAEDLAARAYATLAVALAKSHGHDLALTAIKNTTTLVVDSSSAPTRLDTARAMAVVRGEIAGRVDKDRAIKRLTDVLNDPVVRDFIPLRLESRLEIARLRASLGDTETAASEARTVLEAAKQQNLALTEHHANALLAELK